MLCLRSFILLSILSSHFLAQSSEKLIIAKADSLYNTGNYFDAITEYKRNLFFTGDSFSYYSNVQIGKCYKAGAKFNEAVNYFFRASKSSQIDDEVFSSEVEIIRCNILRRTIDRALEICDQLERDPKYLLKKDELYYWRGWAYMFADDWEMAASCFEKTNLENGLKVLCQNIENEKVSVTFARVISYILPGAGQIYTGNILSGIMSLAWNLFAGYLTVNSFIEQRVFDGVVIGELLWLRFYRGNIQNAVKFAEEKNTQIANNALNYLQNEFKGLKP